LSHSSEAGELVLLHGWASSSDVWRAWLPWLRRRANVTLLDLPGFGRTPADAVDGLDDVLTQLERRYVPERAALLGWSLGGMLAAAFAARFPQRSAALITIATNAVYVQRDDWAAAQTPVQFEEFRRALAADESAQLRRFQALQARGDVHERAVVRTLRQLPAAHIDAASLDRGP